MEKNIGYVIIRAAFVLVFLWFAFNQLTNPDSWTRVVPSIALVTGLSAKTLVFANGTVELALAALLALGLYTRLVSLILSIHLYLIAISFGISPVGIRDFGLASSLLGLFFIGPDKFCLDNKFKQQTS